MDPSSKLDMSLDDIVKINLQQNRQNRQVKRLNNNNNNNNRQRNSFPPRRTNNNGQMNGVRRNFSSNNNTNFSTNNFRSNSTGNGFQTRPLSARTKGIIQINNLSPEVNEDDLNQLFAPLGDLESVQIMYDQLGISRGVAKVVFRQLQEAMDAIEKYNNVRLDGNPMKMYMMHGDLQVGQPRRLTGTNTNSIGGQNRRTDGNRFVRQYDNQRSNNVQRMNGGGGGNFRQSNGNQRTNFSGNNNQRQQRHSTGNFTSGQRQRFQNNNNNNSNNNAKTEVKREDLDRDLEEFLASR